MTKYVRCKDNSGLKDVSVLNSSRTLPYQIRCHHYHHPPVLSGPSPLSTPGSTERRLPRPSTVILPRSFREPVHLDPRTIFVYFFQLLLRRFEKIPKIRRSSSNISFDHLPNFVPTLFREVSRITDITPLGRTVPLLGSPVGPSIGTSTLL